MQTKTSLTGNIIEIGTSDFRTNAGIFDGVYIEPVKYYYDRLPDCNKWNVAVSNFNGFEKIYYIPLEVIDNKKLPNWVRGCNSFGKPHPTLVRYGWSDLITSEYVKVVRCYDIIEKYNIKAIDFLKIDTEGHDCVILNNFFDTIDIKPLLIKFEANELTNKEEVDMMVGRLTKLGYNYYYNKQDIICELQ